MPTPPPSSHRRERTGEERHRGRRRRWSATNAQRLRAVSFATRLIVGISAGVLFAMGMSLAQGSGGRYGSDLRSLIHAKESVVDQLREENSQLQATAEQLQDSSKVAPRNSFDPMRAELRGPGIVVTLDDAPVPEPFPAGLNPDDLVIHQQDIEAVFNALWASGAEAIAIQGMRVQVNTQVSCVGNVININGKLFSPPYEISAIGNAEHMESKLFEDEQVKILQQYVARYSLGFSVKERREIVMEPLSVEQGVEYAKVIAND